MRKQNVLFFLLISLFLTSCSKKHKLDTYHYFQDFEAVKNWYPNTLTTDQIPAHSGFYSAYTDSSAPYSPTLMVKCAAFPKKPKKIKASAWCYLNSNECVGSLCFNISSPKNESKQWFAVNLTDQIKTTGKWTRVFLETNIEDANFSPENVISVFVWNTKSERIFLDDIEVEFVE